MIGISANKIVEWYKSNKEKSLKGRYITLVDIEPLLKKLKAEFIGNSVLKKPIYKYTIGEGKIKILIWSQMHGNEGTGTKALFDLFQFFKNPGNFDRLVNQILTNCTIVFIPMLNPDGADVYTRVNANEIDLNRDAIDLSQPESKLLKTTLKKVNPHYCFNLHDQRTIFSVGKENKTSTLSFLAPSVSEQREVTESRKKTMEVIVSINELMQQIIPNKIGRYTDEFYPTATGDNFQKAGYYTILVEAGHFKDDYDREIVRLHNFTALLQGLNFISSEKKNVDYKDYFDIPNNEKFYLDIIYKNIFIENELKKVDVGILYEEKLKDKKIIFIPKIEIINNLNKYNANTIIDKNGLVLPDNQSLQRFLKKRS